MVGVVKIQYGARHQDYEPDQDWGDPNASAVNVPIPRPDSWGIESTAFKLQEDMESMHLTIQFPMWRVQEGHKIFSDEKFTMPALKQCLHVLKDSESGIQERVSEVCPTVDRFLAFLNQNPSIVEDIRTEQQRLNPQAVLYEAQEVKDKLEELKCLLNSEEIKRQLIVAREVGTWIRSNPRVFDR